MLQYASPVSEFRVGRAGGDGFMYIVRRPVGRLHNVTSFLGFSVMAISHVFMFS